MILKTISEDIHFSFPSRGNFWEQEYLLECSKPMALALYEDFLNSGKEHFLVGGPMPTLEEQRVKLLSATNPTNTRYQIPGIGTLHIKESLQTGYKITKYEKSNNQESNQG